MDSCRGIVVRRSLWVHGSVCGGGSQGSRAGWLCSRQQPPSRLDGLEAGFVYYYVAAFLRDEDEGVRVFGSAAFVASRMSHGWGKSCGYIGVWISLPRHSRRAPCGGSAVKYFFVVGAVGGAWLRVSRGRVGCR